MEAPADVNLTKSTNPEIRYEQSHASLLPKGAQAPDFCLPTTPEQKVCLHDFRGQPVILVFYPADWSPVCGDQLALYNEILPEFKRYGAVLLAVSVDSPWSHMAYSKERNLRFPLLSDAKPKGAVARLYGVYNEQDELANRAIYVLDADHKVHWSYLSPNGINPGADGILEALETLPQPASRKEAVQ